MYREEGRSLRPSLTYRKRSGSYVLRFARRVGAVALLVIGLCGGFTAGNVYAERPFPEPPDSLILANDFIEIVVNVGEENTGRFAVNTTGGDPTRVDDDYK